MTRLPGTVTVPGIPSPVRMVSAAGTVGGSVVTSVDPRWSQVSGYGSGSMMSMVGSSSPSIQVRCPSPPVPQPQFATSSQPQFTTRKSLPTTSTRSSSISTRTGTSSPGAAMGRASKFATVGQTAGSHTTTVRQVPAAMSQRSGLSARFPSS